MVQIHWNRTLAVLTLVVVTGCAQQARAPDSATPEAPLTPADPAAPWETPAAPGAPPPPMIQLAPALQVEQAWLLQWFRDTPVRIAGDADGGLRVDVPLAFSFESARAQPRPALAAVLDRVAESLRRQPAVRVAVGMVGDEGTAAAVTQQRLASLRSALIARGVAATRVGTMPSVAGEPGAALRLSLEIAPLRAPVRPPAGR